MSTTTPTPTVKTRILIISDTHGASPSPKPAVNPPTEFIPSQASEDYFVFQEPLPEADVVLHCGDLTLRSRLKEYEATFNWLRAIPAPLKLVIAGNHDSSLDAEYPPSPWNDDLATLASAQSILREAEADGVRYLTEGTHHFTLGNGARLSVFASQHTPAYGGWAFQYTQGHDFQIPPGVDVAMTHGPPLGVGDYTLRSINAGCPDLFRAVRRARPKIHCFGHIHEAWGAMLASWKDVSEGPVCYGNCIDAAASRRYTLEDIGMRPPYRFCEERDLGYGMERLETSYQPKAISVDLTKEAGKLVDGKQTLFVNAATMTVRYRAKQPAWLVDVDLARAEESEEMDCD